MRWAFRGLCLWSAASVLALAPVRSVSASPPGRPPPAAPRVLLISVDGLRADAVTPDLMPFLDGLRAKSAYTFVAQSLEPTFTIPNHVSMLTGLTPETHGVTEVSDPGDLVVDGTIVEIAHDAGLSTAIYISKSKLRLLHKEGTCDRYIMTDNLACDDVVEAFLSEVQDPATQYRLTFIHLIDLDSVGHQSGWMSDPYKERVTKMDGVLRQSFEALERAGLAQETVVFVVSDHGGHGFAHADDRPEVKNVPWFVTGPGIAAGREIVRAVGTHDTAPTILDALGLPVPEPMEGTVVREVFSQTGPLIFRRGEVDGNGSIELTDAIAILGYLFLGEESLPCEAAAEVDGNLDISLTDAVYLLEHLFRGGEQPPEPYEACGVAEAVPSGITCDVPCR